MSELYTTQQELLSLLPADFTENHYFREAIQLAKKTHQNEKRDGDPYLETHIWPMTLQVYNRYKTDERCLEAVITSLLHDTIESDRKITKSFLAKSFGKEIAENVQILSKTDSEDCNSQTQEEKFVSNQVYLKRISDYGGLPILIKLEDRLANLRSFQKEVFISRPDKYRRYLHEAEELFIPLALRFDTAGNILSDMQKEIQRIKEIIAEQSKLLSI